MVKILIKYLKSNHSCLIVIKVLSITTLFWGVIFAHLCPKTAVAANYYVDATNGDDNDTGLTQDTAWQTLQKINTTLFQPGDFILFKRGETWDGLLKLRSDGNASLFITLGDYGTGNKPEINNTGTTHGISLEGRSYIFVKNLKIRSTGGSGILITESTKNGMIKIEACDISQCKIDGIAIKDRGRVEINNTNVFSNNNNGISAFFSNDNKLWSDKKGEHIKIINCKIYHNYKCGLFLAGDHAVVQRNEMFANGHSRFDHNFYLLGDNGLVEKNIFRDANFGLGFRYLGSRLIFRNNIVKNNRLHGIGLWNDYSNSHYDNKIYDNKVDVSNNNTQISNSMAISIGKSGNAGSFIGVELKNNSLNGVDDGAGGIYLDGCSQVKIQNNSIIIENSYLIYKSSEVTGLMSDYNKFASTKPAPFYYDSHELTFSDWQHAGYDLHSTNLNRLTEE